MNPGTGTPGSHLTRRASGIVLSVVVIALAALVAGDVGVSADEEERDSFINSHRSGPVPDADDLDSLRHHFRAENAEDLEEAEIAKVYADLKSELASRYRISQIALIEDYQSWSRYNRVPYVSATHGNRFVNNYANKTASAYGRYEKAGILPVGSVIAKDTFTISEDGTVRPGPLMIMEKMPEGFNYVSGDWRYAVIMPDGSLLGETRGESAQSVAFCIGCHLVKERFDHLYFMPKKYRIKQ